LCAMRTTIDSAGRIVVPKRIRDELGLTGGQELELRTIDGGLAVEIPATPMRLVEHEGDVVPVADRELPELPPELVRETLERTRR
ncbi:MAG: AbrB/MazE/SpoVT family DNA-binding domain-containing protein, partial [Gammaproteobacteria bacterium]